MLTDGKCRNKIVIQGNYNAAFCLCIILFIKSFAVKLYTNEIGKCRIGTECQGFLLSVVYGSIIAFYDLRRKFLNNGFAKRNLFCAGYIRKIFTAVFAIIILYIALLRYGSILCLY